MVNYEIIIIVTLSVCMAMWPLLCIMEVVSWFRFVSIFVSFLRQLFVLDQLHIDVLIALRGRILASRMMTFLKDREVIPNKIIIIRNHGEWKVGDTCRFHIHLLMLTPLLSFLCRFRLVIEVHLAVILGNTLFLIEWLQWTAFSSNITF